MSTRTPTLRTGIVGFGLAGSVLHAPLISSNTDYLTLRELIASGELAGVHRFESRFETSKPRSRAHDFRVLAAEAAYTKWQPDGQERAPAADALLRGAPLSVDPRDAVVAIDVDGSVARAHLAVVKRTGSMYPRAVKARISTDLVGGEPVRHLGAGSGEQGPGAGCPRR